MISETSGGLFPHRLVRADAGTGKTYRLTLRFLELLAQGRSPDVILAATFTRKAAGEILERVLLRLATAAADPAAARLLADELAWAAGAPERFGELLLAVCSEVHKLQIGTLDAFFHRVAASFRYELGLPRFRLVAGGSDPILQPLRQRALGEALGELESVDVAELAELLARLYRGDAQRSLLPMLDRVTAELHELYSAAPEVQVWGALEVTGEPMDAAQLRSLLESLEARVEHLGRGLERGVRRDLEAARREDWEELLKGGVAKKLVEDPERPSYSRRPIPEALLVPYRKLVAHAGWTLLSRLRHATLATHRLLDSYARCFARARRAAGVALFGELTDGVARAAELLHATARRSAGTGAGIAQDEERHIALQELYFRLDARLQHFLLDEFQDTSIAQWNALEPLIDEALAHADGSHSVFVVGDPKQSIYGWRGGCAELFAELEERFAAGAGATEALRLSYRSSEPVIEAINLAFAGTARNPALDWQPAQAAAARWAEFFEPHATVHTGRPGYVVLETSSAWEGEFADDLPTVSEDEPDAEEPPSEEPRPAGHLGFAAQRVLEILQRLEPIGAARRPSIGVLTATNRTAKEVLEALLQRGVAASGEGGGRIDDDPAVALILSGLHLASHPADNAAAYHLARSPLAAPLGLHDWRQPGRAARVVRVRLASEGARAVVADWAHRLAPLCDRRGAIRLEQLIVAVERLAASTSFDGAELVRLIEQSRIEEPNPSAVRVMTVHKAKGLEFDVVVLCELERRFGQVSGSLLEVAREHALASIAGAYRGTNATVRALSPELERAHAQEVERRIADELGVLYVALTRARRELHAIVQPLEHRSDGSLPEPRNPAAFLRHAWASERSAHWASPERVLFALGEPLGRKVPATGIATPALETTGPALAAASVEDGRGIDSIGGIGGPKPVGVAWIPRPRPVLSPSELNADAASVAELLGLGETLGAGEEPRQAQLERGRLLHAWLREIEWLDSVEGGLDDGAVARGLPSEKRLLALGRRYRPRWSREQVLAEWRQLERALLSTEVRRVFARPLERQALLWRERAFAVGVENAVVRGVFDRVVLYGPTLARRGADLFELKSGRLEGSASAVSELPLDDASAAVWLERYRPQLEAYRAALARIAGVLETAVRVHLVLLDLGIVLEC